MTAERFPSWAPDIHISGDFELTKRLSSYPDMELVWNTLRGWYDELGIVSATGKNESYVADALFRRDVVRPLSDIAGHISREHLGVLVLTKKKQAELFREIRKSARSLSAALRQVAAPPYLHEYIDLRILRSAFIDGVLRVNEGTLNSSEFFEGVMKYLATFDGDEEHDPDLDDLEEEQNRGVDQMRADAIKQALLRDEGRILSSLYNQSIFDVLDALQSANPPLQTPEVIRAKHGGEARLLGIRLFARFIKSRLKRNPRGKEEREIIARIVSTVLDDALHPDDVRDGLRNVELVDL